ncbi:hypothetical protein HCH_01326 [Hahella chejuensis KCTC 2396]|uniref:Uncharacterized protein n=1 Tax=Hahella chejuensis (strain KCTC 2396) TaxID=349521 RepID=Q2SMD0_HAHCH|nr:hypothetical protein HCH_01326 [Hahella chejuensis KCTC 2396]
MALGWAGLGVAFVSNPDQLAQIMQQGFKHARFNPAAGLLVYDLPGRQVVRHLAPEQTAPGNITKGVKDLAQVVHAVRGRFGHQRQIGRYKSPFFIADIGWIRFSSDRLHPQMITESTAHDSHCVARRSKIFECSEIVRVNNSLQGKSGVTPQ